MCLHEGAKTSDNLRRIINNGYFSHHPFKYSSGQLADFISVFHEIRALDSVDFAHCLRSIKTLVENQNDCVGCYGKGLAFIKLLTKGLDVSEHKEAIDRYKAFSTARDWSSDFEEDLLQKMHELGVHEDNA